MDLISNAYLAAFLLGAVHAVEVDHMVAVSVFAGLKPRLKTALGYGARWGIGHALVVVAVGAILAWFEVRVPPEVVSWGEVIVGIALISLGIWALRRSKKFHTHLPSEHSKEEGPQVVSQEGAHGHLHAHNGQMLHDHTHGHSHHVHSSHHQHLPMALGAVHGLAGSAPVLALIPVTLLTSFNQALTYLLLFSVGTTLSMMAYAGLAAAAMQCLSLSQRHVVRLTMSIAIATIAVGLWWLVGALFLGNESYS